MSGSTSQSAFLRQIPLDKTAHDAFHPLSANHEILVGRDPRCQIILDSLVYGGVSRQHIKLVPIASGWQVCDLDSANGTYVNGQRLQGCRVLKVGDRIVLGQNGPQFVFEMQTVSQPQANQPVTPFPAPGTFPATGRPHSNASPDPVTLSQLFPIVSTGKDLTRKAYLVPGIITVSFVVLMFLALGNTIFFNMLIAAYISGAAYYFVYQLCGKRKPWWVLISAAVVTILLLVSPVLSIFIFVFRQILPGAIPEGAASSNFLTVLVQMFFGAGLMEELLKAIPIFLAAWIGARMRSPLREKLGVWEPLDGILLGCASAVGFTLLETLGQYVPNIVNDVTLQAGQGAAELVGLQLLIPRILGSIAGHMAYSGYFGYFIGLSVLKPSKRWKILAIGYLSASILHALWNSSGLLNLFVLALVGVLSYAFLAAAILKARALSPTRSQNFATRFSRLS